MKRALFFCLTLMALNAMYAQSFSDRFDDAFATNDVAAQRQALQDWELSAPEDVNLIIACYNFYANQAMEQTPYLAQLADSGLLVIERGIVLYPDRLDLRFGKIFFLGELRRWDAFADEIMRMLDYSDQINHRWLFPNVEEGLKELVMEGVADYQLTMRETLPGDYPLAASDSAMVNRIRRVAKRTVQLFPSDVNALHLLGETYLGEDDERASKYLKRAEELLSRRR
ncbi:MAG: hypothetical protein IKG81_08145 [Bacteroidales bacterium]|nr:hypothetical protein [Bacteroidales bacterium]